MSGVVGSVREAQPRNTYCAPLNDDKNKCNSGIWWDSYELTHGINTSEQNNNAQPVVLSESRVRFRRLVCKAIRAKQLIGTEDTQLMPGIHEYFYPPPIRPLKGLEILKKLVFGARGAIHGVGDICRVSAVGRGISNILSFVVFSPFVMVCVVVDAPRFLGDHLLRPSNRFVLQGIGRGGVRGSLLTLAGGFLRLLVGAGRLVLPVAALVLGVLSGGWFGLASAFMFETVYLSQDLTYLTNAEWEEMNIFKGLRDMVAGLSVILGAEFVDRLSGATIHKLFGTTSSPLEEGTQPN